MDDKIQDSGHRKSQGKPLSLPAVYCLLSTGLDRAIHIVETVVIFVALGSMVGMIFTEVVLGFFRIHLTWTHEASLYLMVWVTCVGASVAVRGGEHMRIDVLVRLLRGRAKSGVAILSFLLCSFFCFAAVKVGLDFVDKAREFGEQSAALKMPVWIMYTALPAAGVLLGLRFLLKVMEEIFIKSTNNSVNITT